MLSNKIIEATEFNFEIRNDKITMHWLGKSNSQKPYDLFISYFNEIIDDLVGKKLIIDFRKLEYMNSATVSAIVQLFKMLNSKNIDTIVLYDNTVKWQSLSFQAMGIVVISLKNINIEGR